MANNSELEEFEFRARLEAEQQQSKQPPPPGNSLRATMEQQTKGDMGTALQTGIANATSRLVHGVGQLLPDSATRYLEQRGVMPTQADIDLLEAGTAASPAARVAHVGADVAMAALPAMHASQGGRALSRTLGRLPAALPALAETGAMGGYGALTADEGKGVEGAAWGAGGTLAGLGLARTMRGLVTPAPEARALLDRGVALTPGQAAGAGTLANRFEQALTSNPVSGLPIRNAQRRGLEEANRAAAQEVANLVDNSVRLGLPPREAIEQTRELVGRTYDQALQGMTVPGFVPESYLRAVHQRLASDFPMMEQAQIDQMDRFITNRVGNMVRNNGGNLTGEMLKQLDSEIGQHVRNLHRSTTAADKTAAPAWAEAQQYLREVMEQAHASPEQSAQLRAANAAYRQLLAIERSMLPGAETFTPRQLQRQLDKAGIRNTGLNEVADAMTRTIPNSLPDSGTAERLLLNSMPALLLGGGAGAQSMGWDTIGTGMMAAGALGSRPGARFVTGQLPGQARAYALINALRRPAAAADARLLSNPSGAYPNENNE